METGEVQLGAQTPIPLNDVRRLSGLPNIGTTTDGYEYFAPIVTMQFNNMQPPFDNMLVRKAVAYAMNRDLIIRNVWFGLGKVATGPISSKSEYYTGDVEKHPYDPTKAEAAAGASRVQEGSPTGFVSSSSTTCRRWGPNI